MSKDDTLFHDRASIISADKGGQQELREISQFDYTAKWGNISDPFVLVPE